MKKIILLAIYLFLFSLACFSQDIYNNTNNPIILVHGFSGWGRDEMLGYKYWGGIVLDIEEHLTKQGFLVFSASVGAISSNHDRACELFYQIKGGKVNYGAEHSYKYGHLSSGKTYSGFFPKWDESHPIHLVGHSMGGQTIRVLTELLAQDYFKLGTTENWIKSITTISTPHNGTTLATMIRKFSGGLAEEIVAAFLGIVGSDWKIYNFDMDQWELKANPGETLKDFMKRIDKKIGETQDISMYDLLPEGANSLNQNIRTFPKIYYFSYATQETYILYESQKFHWAKPTMNPIFWGYSNYMGRYQGNEVFPNADWWPNDGVVNTISMKGPNNATIIPFDGEPKVGLWNFMGTISDKDHGKIIGHYVEPISGRMWLKKFYLELAEMLASLK